MMNHDFLSYHVSLNKVNAPSSCLFPFEGMGKAKDKIESKI